MNKLKILENDDSCLEISAESAEILMCKQFLNPITTDYVQFIFDNFTPEWLRTQERQDLFQIAKKFWLKREKIPSEKMMLEIFKNDRFSNKEEDLVKEYNKIVNFDEDKLDPQIVKETIKSFIKNKSIYFAILDNYNNLSKEGVIGGLLSRFEKIVQLDVSDDLGIEYFENFDKHCEELTKKNDKIPFGFKWLDERTYGGLPVNETCLFVIMAKPGFGKSQFMMNIAANWIANNKKVLMVSLEMSESMYSRRMDGLFSNLNINKLRENIDSLRSRVQGFKANAPDALLRIKEYPTGTLTPAVFKQYLKKLKQTKEFSPDIIFIDYLNIMRPNGNNAGSLSLYEKAGRIAEELRAISSELKVPIVTATQQNRCVFSESTVFVKNKGNIKIKDVNIGDEILSKNGNFNIVKDKFNIEKRECFKITTKSGNSIICSKNHVWPTDIGEFSIETGLNIHYRLVKRTLLGCIADNIGLTINKIKRLWMSIF